MKRNLSISALGLVVLVLAAVLWHQWKQDEPRRNCLASIQSLHAALASPDANALTQIIVLPAALQGRTAAEKAEFIRKSLRDELSPEGLELLKRHARFGPLTNLFPGEGIAWATQAGVKPEDCLAFRLDRTNAPRAEVVLARDSAIRNPQSAFRVLRLNNIKPLAATGPSTTNRHP